MPSPKRRASKTSDKKPLFERRDVVRVIGIPSPLMLVTGVAEEPEEENDEFTVTVIWFDGAALAQEEEYEFGRQFPEGLLQLVTPAAKVVEEAEAATREARGSI